MKALRVAGDQTIDSAKLVHAWATSAALPAETGRAAKLFQGGSMAKDKIVFSQKNVNLIARIVQQSARVFEEMAPSCKHSNGHGGCKINTADGCLALGCPMGRE